MTTTRTRIAAIILSVLSVFALSVGTASACTDPVVEPVAQIITDNAWAPVDPSVLAPCEYEDTSGMTSSLCYWDAQARGNGEGTSFVAGVTPEQTAVFWYPDGTVEVYDVNGEPVSDEACETLTIEDGYVFCEG